MDDYGSCVICLPSYVLEETWGPGHSSAEGNITRASKFRQGETKQFWLMQMPVLWQQKFQDY